MSKFSLLQSQDPLRPPETPAFRRGLAFALVAHALLIVALSAGVNWRAKTLPSFEAELWTAVPQAAAPKELTPPVEPEPEPEPKSPPRTEATPPQPSPEALQAQRDAEIAIAKAREDKLKRQREAELEAERKKKAEQLAKQQEAAKKAERERQEQQARLERLEKQRQERLKNEADAKREALRQENLRRIQGMAGASGAPDARGAALQSSGPSASYGGRIKARIRPNIIYTDSVSGNPIAEVEVRVAPDGSIIGRKLLKPSGDAEWDKAVLRAIDKTETLPRDVDGRVPPLLVISFQPRE